MEYAKYILFESFKSIKIERPLKFGGEISLSSYDELAKLYREGEIHPLDLKNTVASYINKLLVPVREYFEKNQKAGELAKTVKAFGVTR